MDSHWLTVYTCTLLTSAQCTLCNVYTVHSVHSVHSVHIAQCTHCTVYTLHSVHIAQCTHCTVYTLHSVHCAQCTHAQCAHCTVCTCTVHSVHCALCTVPSDIPSASYNTPLPLPSFASLVSCYDSHRSHQIFAFHRADKLETSQMHAIMKMALPNSSPLFPSKSQLGHSVLLEQTCAVREFETMHSAKTNSYYYLFIFVRNAGYH